MSEPSKLDAELTEMAHDLIRDVAEKDIETRIDAFKALSSFFLGRTKLGKREPPEPDISVSSMASMRDRVSKAGEKTNGADGTN